VGINITVSGVFRFTNQVSYKKSSNFPHSIGTNGTMY